MGVEQYFEETVFNPIDKLTGFESGAAAAAYSSGAFNWWKLVTLNTDWQEDDASGRISGVTDRQGNTNMASPTAGTQPVLDSALVAGRNISRGYNTDPNSNNNYELLQEGVTTPTLIYNQFKFMHDGSAFTAFFVVNIQEMSASSGSRVVFHTATGGTNGGIFINMLNNNQVQFFVYAAAPRPLSLTGTLSSSISVGTHLLYCGYDDSLEEYYIGVDQQPIITAAKAGVNSTTDHLPAYLQRVTFGAHSFAEGLTFKSDLRASNLSTRVSSIMEEWGINQTSLNDEQYFVILGDSIAEGASEAVGPTPTSGTVFEWDGASNVEITSSDVSTANLGSPWPQFGVTFNGLTEKKIVLQCDGASGSEFYPHLDTNNWSTSGTLYAPMVTKAKAGMANIGVTAPRAVIVVLGINDARGTETIANIETAAMSLITRLTADFPSSDIFLVEPGNSGSPTPSQRILDVRQIVNDLATDNTNTYMGFDEVKNFYNADPGLDRYMPDILHPNQKGNNEIGSTLASFINNT